MASRPLESFVLKAIEEQGGWEACVFERIEAGETQTSIAHSFGISHGWLSRLIHKDPARAQGYQSARKRRAALYAEQAKDLADGVSENKDAIAKVREQIGVRRWLAAVDDRDTYGEQPTVQVQVNVADIHLDSLRHRMIEASRPLAEALHQVLPFPQINAGTSRADSEGENDNTPVEPTVSLQHDSKGRPLVLQEEPVSATVSPQSKASD